MYIPSRIYLYDGSRTNNLKLREIIHYLIEMLGNIDVIIREDFISFYLRSVNPNYKEQSVNTLAEKLAECRIRQIDNKIQQNKPLPIFGT